MTTPKVGSLFTVEEVKKLTVRRFGVRARLQACIQAMIQEIVIPSETADQGPHRAPGLRLMGWGSCEVEGPAVPLLRLHRRQTADPSTPLPTPTSAKSALVGGPGCAPLGMTILKSMGVNARLKACSTRHGKPADVE